MVLRIRTRSSFISNGKQHQAWGEAPIEESPVVASRDLYNNKETVTDEVSPGNGKEFTVDRYYYKGTFPLFNGTYSRFGNVYVVNLPPGGINDPTFALYEHNAIGGSPTLEAATARIVSLTNPSRPLVDLPIFLTELREVPALLLQRSRDIGADIARGRLSAEFGWKPLIRDLIGFVEFKQAFAQRVREINALRKSGLRRKRIIFNGSSTPRTVEYSGFSPLSNDRGLVVNATTFEVTTEKVTGFVKWFPDMEIPRHLGLQNDLAEQKAIFALLGLNPYVIDASTIWNLLPYSWLADWCTNWGDYFAAHRNIVGAHPENILIMRHYLTEQMCSLKAGGSDDEKIWFSQCAPSQLDVMRYRETKRRQPGSLQLSAHMPFLSERKVMILADLVRSQLPGKIRRRK